MKQDYSSMLALFENGTLTLTNRTLSAEACALLEQVTENATSRSLAAIADAQAIELLNRDAVIAQQVPYVVITADGAGTLSLPAYQLRLVSFHEIVERLQPAIETFERYLADQDLPFRHSYRRNLSTWGHMDADHIARYRKWLSQYIPKSEHETKLEAITLYCQLAAEDGYLYDKELDAIIEAINQPLTQQDRRTRRKKE